MFADSNCNRIADERASRESGEAGIKRVALSLDAPRPEIHDDFRKVKGSWQRTMDTLHRAHDVGLSVQVNTTVAKYNVDILHEMVPFIQEVGAVQWSVFFLVPTGRTHIRECDSQMIICRVIDARERRPINRSRSKARGFNTGGQHLEKVFN